MSEKILLIRPKNFYNYNNYPPLNLISLGSGLKAKGYEVKIINSPSEEDTFQVLREELKDTLFVGISLLTAEVPDAYRIMTYVKKNSDVPVVVGGWHSTLFPEQMADCEFVDYVVAGEGEEHISEIANSLKNKNPIEKKIFRKVALDMETLPVPDYDMVEDIEFFINNFLTDKLSEVVPQPMRWLPYETSRGCPSLCTFCINVVAGNTRYRKKSAGKVIEEIEHIVKKYRLTHLKIIDDNFFVDIKRVREICTAILEKKLNITWDAECRCDYFNDRMLNDETLALLTKSGLVQLTVGIESGSLHTLKLMKKGITPEQAEYAIKKCNDFKIIVRPSFIIEIPGETMDDIKKTIKFVNRFIKYPHFSCGVQTFRPYPKCELTENLIENGFFAEPKTFLEWTDTKNIEIYVSAHYLRPWQVDGKFSETAAFFLTMESGGRLRNDLIDRAIDRLKNKIFIMFAKLRNRTGYYNYPIDKVMYRKFIKKFYQRRAEVEERDTLSVSS